MRKILIFSYLLLFFFNALCYAQQDLSDLSWKKVVYDQPDAWYGTKEAISVAENVLLYQRDVGGWPKNTAMHRELAEGEKEKLLELKSKGIGATIDNGATVTELDFLSKVYSKTNDEQYRKTFHKGINYLLEAQYENGGWPQYYPQRKGYYTHITYNDNAMLNVMNVMKSIAEKGDRFSVELDDAIVLKAKTAYEKGVEVILKTQYNQNGVLTAWCAQHDEETLLPALARSYELPSLSGSESVDIVLLLMEIDNPSPEIIAAIQSAVAWFDQVKIEGIRIERSKNKEGKNDRKVIQDNDAPTLWARFYDLEDNRPFFCDRDGIKKNTLAEIGYERRNGYGWYDNDPKDVLKTYKSWQPKWAPKENVLDKSNKKKNCIATPADEKRFKELYQSKWKNVFSDKGTKKWQKKWSLDGKIGHVENGADGMALYTGPERKNSAHDVVLWTKQSFSGDLLIEYDYTRIDNRDRSVNIIYIQATGSQEGEYSKNIKDWNAMREVPAMQVYYNNMNTLHISYAAFSEDGDYIRARRYRPDLKQKMTGTELGAAYNTGFFEKDVKHHITIIKKGFDLYMKVSTDQKSVLYKWNYQQHPKIVEGPIGLRHKCVSAAVYKNFTVKKLLKK